jgi:hypothetical protein
MTPCERVGHLRQKRPYVRVITIFFYWLSSKMAKMANMPSRPPFAIFPGSQSDANARDAAVAASLALQFGCPLETLRHALLRDSHGWPSTPLGAAVDNIAAEAADE